MKILFINVLFLLGGLNCLAQGNVILNKGVVSASISPAYTGKDDSTKITGLVNGANNILKQTYQVAIPVSGKATNNPVIKIGLISRFPELKPLISTDKFETESFYLKAINNKIYITAATYKGLEFGINNFLERFFKIYAVDVKTFETANLTTVTVPSNLNMLSTPAFSFRYLYSQQAFDLNYANFNSLSNYNIPNINFKVNYSSEYGALVQNVNKVIDPKTYFATHPEYYALVNNKRTPTQLCLSNQDVLAEYIKNFGEEISLNPKAKYWSICHNDIDTKTEGFCECDKCKALFGDLPNSDRMLYFVNAVAKKFPGVTITTLAFKTTRKPPVTYKPAANVSVIVCAFECDHKYPYESASSPENQLFVSDLNKWLGLTKKIIVWDYTTNFSNPGVIFPNFGTIQKNLLFYQRLGIKQIFMQHLGISGGEFQELKSFLYAKLLWNPRLNQDSIINVFSTAYYKQYGSIVSNLISDVSRKVAVDKEPIYIYDTPLNYRNGLFSASNLMAYDKLYHQQDNAANASDQYKKRFEITWQAIRVPTIIVYDYLKTQDASHYINNPLGGANNTFKQIQLYNYRNELLKFKNYADFYKPTMVLGKWDASKFNSRFNK